ncbi:MAG TPA: CBS domain-containing protein [Gemmatimonadota bacterium]|nr:CBS domain-containing protein [Gemmatimonadota bacterium]
MTRPVITVGRQTNLEKVARLMLEKEIGSVVVVDDDGSMIGIVTDTDFAARKSSIPFSTFELPQLLGRWLDEEGVQGIYRKARSMEVAEIMTTRVWSVEEDTSIERVVQVMLERNIDHVPVVDGERPVGMIAHRDLLKLLLETEAGSQPA